MRIIIDGDTATITADRNGGTVRPWARQLVAAGLLAVLVVMALVVAPDLASHTGPGMHLTDPSWLGAVLDRLTD